MTTDPTFLAIAAAALALVAFNVRDLWQHATGTHWCDQEDTES